ncbi:MAG: hypothetical protein CFE21_11675 [Bacteroidetes bacterium B1(2017)]|nr:MAG: hypothetical protein CFE21_11675 [Bacteroidetes bacterium B1(2017)]
MKTPLHPISIPSIYKNSAGAPLPLPLRMALCTPDTLLAIEGLAQAIAKQGGKLVLSDLYRSYDMQAKSHQDYIKGRKKAFSPPPGGSLHEAGRAFDLDLSALKIPLPQFWALAATYGIQPIIKTPNPKTSEAWHFDCFGSHALVYTYYKAGKGTNLKPYAAAAASAILATGVHVDLFGSNQTQAALQASLIRLGKNIGNIDGKLGPLCMKALLELNIAFEPLSMVRMLLSVEALLKEKFPAEYE